MFKVTGKKNGTIWDAEKNCPLAVFADGEFRTDDQKVAERLRDMGFAVEGKFKKPDPPAENPDPMAEMTVPQLEAYAKEKGYDLGGATKRADILAAIKKAEEDAPADNQ